jgi:hypothetical protein
MARSDRNFGNGANRTANRLIPVRDKKFRHPSELAVNPIDRAVEENRSSSSRPILPILLRFTRNGNATADQEFVME